MKKDDTQKPQTQEKETSLGRRRLLKALTAGTAGGAAAALIPGEWKKPIINSAITPAHAQASPPGGGGGVQDCSIPERGITADTNTSWSMFINSRAPIECGTSARVDIFFAGANIGSCFDASGSGSGNQSWSCSAEANTGLSDGDQVTFVVTWSNGCVCSVVDTVD